MRHLPLCVFPTILFSALSAADSVGHWRFDEDGAAVAGGIGTAVNSIAPGTLDASPVTGTPAYSDDVPDAQIYDPVTETLLPNGFSFDASVANSRLSIADDPALNTSFTIECFIKIPDEPGGYHSYVRRREANDLRWQIDYDHAAGNGYGRIRSRWDTPVDENVNFVVGPRGGVNAKKIFVDTGAKDAAGADVGPQNTGNPADYIYDADSANPNETDVSLQGDGINDDGSWHHVALCFDETTGEVSFFSDYALAERRTLADTFDDGYTHPAAAIVFGKTTGQDYALLIDELRFSDAVLATGEFLRAGAPSGAEDTVAYWRLEEANATAGSAVVSAENSVSPLHAATRRNGSPTYSADVPAPVIFDPVADTYLPNTLSLDSTAANSRIGAENDIAFDISFTFEMFIKLGGEPTGYQSFVRRQQASDLRWQIDFDHNLMGAFGRARSRWDTPGGVSDGVSDANDENSGFVVGPTGGANVTDANRLWIDTDAGDGLVASYDDAVDWALDGDGANDVNEWRHIALTFDDETGTVEFYFDYELMQSRALSDSEANGYTHPAARIDFGKFSTVEYGLLIDEIRLSKAVLLPGQFLQAVAAAPPAFEITDFTYDPDTKVFTLDWRAEPDVGYSVDRYDGAIIGWQELEDSLTTDGTSLSYEDTGLEPGRAGAIYRVRVSQ